MRKGMILGTLAFLGLATSPAFADEFTGIRLGIGLSQDTLRADSEYLGYFDKFNATRLGWNVNGGYTFNKWLAVEGAYRGGGDFSQDLRSGGAFPNQRLVHRTKMQAFEASAVGSWWFNPNFSVYGRAGLYAWKGENTYTEDIDVSDPDNVLIYEKFKDDGVQPMFGLGLQTEMDGAWVRLEYQMVFLDDYGSTTMTPSVLDTKLESLQLSIVWFLH